MELREGEPPVFYEVFAIFVEQPWVALVPAVVFYLLYYPFRLKLVLVAALLWTVYAIYELGIWYGLLCDQDCNIRVDLLVIYPLLAVISGLAILQMFWTKFRPHS